MADEPQSKAEAVGTILQGVGCLIMGGLALVVLVVFIVSVIAC